MFFASFIILNPNVEVRAYFKLYRSPNVTRAFYSSGDCECFQTMNFTWRGDSVSNINACADCVRGANNTLRSIYISYLNPHTWAFQPFGNIYISIVLYCIGVTWIILSCFIIRSDLCRAICPSDLEVDNDIIQTDVKKQEYKEKGNELVVVDIMDRGESVLPNLAIGQTVSHTKVLVLNP